MNSIQSLCVCSIWGLPFHNAGLRFNALVTRDYVQPRRVDFAEAGARPVTVWAQRLVILETVLGPL